MSALPKTLASLLVFPLLLSGCGGDEETEAGGPAATAAAASASASAGEEALELADEEVLSTEQAMQKYQADCPGQTTPECKRLQWLLEFALYEDLRELARANELDDELIRTGAAAETPQLKAFCLDRMLSRGLQPEDAPLVIAAFDDPYPLVRAVAHALARQLPDEKWARMLARDSGRSAEGAKGLTPGVAPDAGRLGAPLYPGATYWHFASSPSFGAFFTSPDDPEDVVAFYAKGGKPTLDAEELTARIEEARSAAQDPTRVMQLMQEAMEAGKDPQTVMSSLTAGASGSDVDWTEGIEGAEGAVAARYVVLAEEELFGRPVPSRVVAIFRDEAMDATSLVFRSKPAAATPEISTPEAMRSYLQMQKALAKAQAEAMASE